MRTKNIRHRIILLILTAAAASSPALAQDPASTIAPMIDDQTFAVVRFDVGRLDAAALAKWALSIAGEQLQGIDDGIHLIGDWQRSFADAGGREIYVILSLADLPEASPPIIVPVPAGADAEAIAAALARPVAGPRAGRRSRPGTARRTGPFGKRGTAIPHGDFVIGAQHEWTLDRLRALEPSPRPELAAAFAAAGDGPIQVVLIPSPDQRRVFTETLSQLPPPLSQMSGTMLSRGVQWAALGLSLPPAPSIRLVIQSADADAARALGEAIPEALAAATGSPQLRRTVPRIDRVARLLTPEQSESRLTLDMNAQQVEELARIVLAPAIDHARQQSRLAASMSNLLHIGQGLAMYAYEHDRQWPANLQVLVDAGRVRAEHLISPISGKGAYIYIRPSKKARDTYVAVYEDPKTHGLRQTPVLFCGSNVNLEPVNDRFREMVAKAKRFSAAAYSEDAAP